MLGVAALLCLWHLTRNGYANSYYAAAVRSGSESWKAFFFGSLDPGSFITIDKPPLSLWLMDLSARLFGFSSFSILLPQALCTIATVGLLYATVRRAFGPAAGLIAAGALAITPVTVAIGRVNNPDALLVLLLVASAWFALRAIESGRTVDLVWCGAIVGLAFMTKLLQGWMVVPALSAAYLLAGPPRLSVRLRQLAVAGAAMVVVSAAWPLAVSLWPASSRPHIGGSTDGSVWDVILGANGVGRLAGTGSLNSGGGVRFGGDAGLWRLFNERVGGQGAWLIPLAAVSLVAGLWIARRAPRTDLRRAAWVLFGLWALVHVAVFSFQKGVFHPYYVSSLAPAVAALCGGGVVVLWRAARSESFAFVALYLALAGSAWLAVDLLSRTPGFAPGVRPAIAIADILCIAALAVSQTSGSGGRPVLAVAGVAGAVALAAGPAAYSVASVGRSLTGSDVRAGPGDTSAVLGDLASGRVVSYLKAQRGSAKYVVATNGRTIAAQIIIQTGLPVVTIGGFIGSDPAPTVSELQKMVARGQLRHVLLVRRGALGAGGSASEAVVAWVKQHGTAVEGLGSGVMLYRVASR